MVHNGLMDRYLEPYIKNDTLIDNKPSHMIQVKESDDDFSKSLYKFRASLKDVKPLQLVYTLKRRKSARTMQMLSVHEFLAGIDLTC